MRILVVADSHGDVFGLHCALEAQPKAGLFIHLGDGYRDMDGIAGVHNGIKTVQVKGNADFGSLLPYSSLEIVEGKRIFCTHGNWLNVKFGDYELLNCARNEKADIVLYGHTHCPRIDYSDGLYIFNPGSIRDGDYGVVDITKAGIVCVQMKLNF